MATLLDPKRVLADHLGDPSSSFSIGSYGAIGEFRRDPDEPLVVDDPERHVVATARGALRLEIADHVVPLAYEMLSSRAGRWQQGVTFCLPRGRGLSRRRTELTEVGPDADAVHAEHRDAILFDMGLGADNVDFCVRTDDAVLIDCLRRNAGRSVLDPASPAMADIKAASPHRVVVSRLGRVEVYQEIGREKTPEGPHTHVLPKLLATGRTHSANMPVPPGSLPGLSLYPANPQLTATGDPKPFDGAEHRAFQTLLAAWGPPEYVREKERAILAVQLGDAPDDYVPHDSRLGRTALRIALRQFALTMPRGEALVAPWYARFDRSDPD